MVELSRDASGNAKVAATPKGLLVVEVTLAVAGSYSLAERMMG